MIEVERKYRSPGNDGVVKALTELGAHKVFEGLVEDTYFAHPSREFGKTDEALRLRRMEGSVELTYKGPRMKLENTKAREEVTVKLQDALSLQRIIERLGFQERQGLRKHRISFVLDKLRVEVDDVEGLGQFVELELITEEPARAESLMKMATESLGLEELEPKTYLEMTIEKHA